jgi:hypothetical protein
MLFQCQVFFVAGVELWNLTVVVFNHSVFAILLSSFNYLSFSESIPSDYSQCDSLFYFKHNWFLSTMQIGLHTQLMTYSRHLFLC